MGGKSRKDSKGGRGEGEMKEGERKRGRERKREKMKNQPFTESTALFSRFSIYC